MYCACIKSSDWTRHLSILLQLYAWKHISDIQEQIANLYPLFTDWKSFVWMQEKRSNNELVHNLIFILMDADLALANLPAHTPSTSQKQTAGLSFLFIHNTHVYATLESKILCSISWTKVLK